MIAIGNYIAEKLKIDKDVHTGDPDPFTYIMKATLFDEKNKELTNALKSWISYNSVKNIHIYIVHHTELYKHMHKLETEIKKSLMVIEYGDYAVRINKLFGKKKKLSNILLQDNYKDLIIYQTSEVLNIKTRDFDMLVEKQ